MKRIWLPPFRHSPVEAAGNEDADCGLNRPRRVRTHLERDTQRLVAFTDGVLAITITLLVLGIRPPEDTRHLVSGLADLWPSYLAYVVSFLLIGQIWANHHAMFDHIRAADRTLFFLNILLLMDVAFLPFTTAILASALHTEHGQRAAVVFYGAVFVVGSVFFNAIWEYARHRHQLLGSTIDQATALSVSKRFRLTPIIYLAGTLLGALIPAAGVAVFGTLILFNWLPLPNEKGGASLSSTTTSTDEGASGQTTKEVN
jgi:uncharacterized membrane protein